MKALVEEFKVGECVFILLKTTKDFLFGEYIVEETTYKNIKNQYAKVVLKKALKKKRYFKLHFEFDGFHIRFENTSNEFLVFDSYDEMVEEFSKFLNKHQDKNPKLTKKFKNLYPQYFKFRN